MWQPGPLNMAAQELPKTEGSSVLYKGQALNSVPTARFTHLVREPASSTSSELVGGCAPKPLPSFLGYVSIGISILDIVLCSILSVGLIISFFLSPFSSSSFATQLLPLSISQS